MRRAGLWLTVVGALMTGVARPTVAQERPAAASAVAIYNAEATLRVIGAYDVPAGRSVDGAVGVLNGPVVIAGRIGGSLAAINADVRLEAGARIEGDLFIVGGTLVRAEGSVVTGRVSADDALLHYTMDGDRIETTDFRARDWRPRIGTAGDMQRAAYTDLFFVAARTYNRVEGLPVLVGPRFRRTTDWGRIQAEALGVVRTAEPVRWDRGTIGHDARLEVRVGDKAGVVLGGRLFDVIDPVEAWQLRNTEAGLSTFLTHRDLRDHFGRHGAEGTLGGRIGEEISLELAVGSERWRSVRARNPLTLINDRAAWRANPPVDAGTMDMLSLRLSIDTRERLRAPWLGGWYMRADLERGRGILARTTATALLPDTPPAAAAPVTYTRGFVDARRYTNLSPGTQLNLRLVAAGHLGGDPMPQQRRLSVGGPGSVEGYDFRRVRDEADVFTCGGVATLVGRAADCDRIALAQVELRQDFNIGWVRSDDRDDWWRPGFNGRGQWVLFADAGRGWTVDRGSAEIRQDRGLPELSTFRTSLGAGVDFGGLGIYFAKAVSSPDERVNVLVRLGRRF